MKTLPETNLFHRQKQRKLCTVSSRFAMGIVLATAAQSGWAGCSVNAQSVNFGNYSPFSSQPTDSAGNIGVTCDVITSYSIALSAGGGTYTARVMTSAGHLLYYNLYSDIGRNIVWGDGIGGVSSTLSGSGTSVNHPVYGRIPARQNAYVGSYGDTITVTLNF